MLQTDAEYDAAYIDSASFADCKTWPGGEINFSGIISEPVKLSDLFFEIIDLVDCKAWVAENLKITIRKNIPNRGGRIYSEITDEFHIIENSGSVDINEDSRITRLSLYWDKITLGDVDKPESYNRLDIGIEAGAESGNEYAESIEKEIFCRWIRQGYFQEELLTDYISSLVARYVIYRRDASPLIDFDLELKDSDIKTGDFLKLSTDELLAIDGKSIDKTRFQIVKREQKGNIFRVIAQRMPIKPVFLIALDATPGRANATEADREYGFICADNGLMPDDKPAYNIY